MASRFDNRTITRNRNELYKKFLEDRSVNYFRHYRTPVLSYPTTEQVHQLTRVGHVWVVGDKYYKLAHRYYGESRYWWVIAWFNKTPTEAHLSLGDTIYIPLPLHTILSFFRV